MIAASRATGSSPRGRGKHTTLTGWVTSVGLIPAWAGKTLGCGSRRSSRRAHPRVGGENEEGGQFEHFAVGSSPRGRGKPVDVAASAATSGLIPAWAGKTPRRRASSAALTAHPRVGGENHCIPIVGPCIAGSSPRGRGKLVGRHGFPSRLGLIPAWAGKTHVARLNLIVGAGSSPRGRGKP